MSSLPVANQQPTKAVDHSNKSFWERMNEVREIIQGEAFGKDVGFKGGKNDTKFKDTESLINKTRLELNARNIFYFISGDDVKTDIVVLRDAKGERTHYLTSGRYKIDWYCDNELAFTNYSYGAFGGEANQATHGALTVARSSMLFSIFDAPLKSEEEWSTEREQALNRQGERKGAIPKSNNLYEGMYDK